MDHDPPPPQNMSRGSREVYEETFEIVIYFKTINTNRTLRLQLVWYTRRRLINGPGVVILNAKKSEQIIRQ